MKFRFIYAAGLGKEAEVTANTTAEARALAKKALGISSHGRLPVGFKLRRSPLPKA